MGKGHEHWPPHAAERYLDGRKLELSTRSLKKERQLLVQPPKFFGATPLNRIGSDGLLTYRDWRSGGTALKGSYLNMEMGAIRRLFKRAKQWHLIGDDVRPLKEHKDIGRALTKEQKSMLLEAARSRAEWQVAYCAAILALNTTMRGGEIRNLQWRAVN
jgi:integrase